MKCYDSSFSATNQYVFECRSDLAANLVGYHFQPGLKSGTAMRKALVFLSIPLLAHDLYFLPPSFRLQPGEKIRIAFHNGDAFPESETNAPIERIRNAQAMSKTGSTPITGLRKSGKEVLGEAAVPGSGDVILSARTVPNFIQMEPTKFEAYLKEEGLDHALRWRSEHGQSKLPGKERYSKYVKALMFSGEPSSFFDHVVGFVIEIIAESNPSLLKPGEKLPIRVQFRGKPVVGLAVESAVAPLVGQAKVTVVGKTDKGGRVSVPITHRGRWRIHTMVMERCAEQAAADWESFWATLTFENR